MSKDLVQPQPSPDQPLCDHLTFVEQLHDRARGITWHWDSTEVMALEAANRLASLLQEAAELRMALSEIAKQKLRTEMDEDLIEGVNADWENGYECCVLRARSALSPTSGDRTESAPRSPVVETNQSIRLAVIEECAVAIRERRWSADPAAITGGSEVGFANERELAAFVLGLEEAVNIVRGTVLK